MNPNAKDNLIPCTPENARERQKKSVEKRKENTEKRKMLSAIYADFLTEKFKLKTAEGSKEVTGEELCIEVTKKVLARGDSSSVAMLKEIREATEGNKFTVEAEVDSTMQSTEERLKQFESLISDDGK